MIGQEPVSPLTLNILLSGLPMARFSCGPFMTILSRRRYYRSTVLQFWQRPGNRPETVLQPVIKTKTSLCGQQFEQLIISMKRDKFENICNLRETTLRKFSVKSQHNNKSLELRPPSRIYGKLRSEIFPSNRNTTTNKS